MAYINNLGDLKEKSLRVYDGMTTVMPQLGNHEEHLHLDLAPRFDHSFAMNNGVVCFVDGNEIWVTPFTEPVMNVLREAGFNREEFYVPFSNWDFPKSEVGTWKKLQGEARDFEKEAFRQDCIDFCDAHNIGELDPNILENCFKMPEEGMEVTKFGERQLYFPVVTQRILTHEVKEKLGHYTFNNGVAVFVYRDGNTYVSKLKNISNQLFDAGYHMTYDLFVPFSNGEAIVDGALKLHWNNLCTRAG